MEPKELLNDFVFFLPSGKLLELHRNPSGLDDIPSGLDLSVSGECQMGEVPIEGTPTLKSVKKVFDTRECIVIMTYLVLGMYAIYIILMGLRYWVGLVE